MTELWVSNGEFTLTDNTEYFDPKISYDLLNEILPEEDFQKQVEKCSWFPLLRTNNYFYHQVGIACYDGSVFLSVVKSDYRDKGLCEWMLVYVVNHPRIKNAK